MVAVLTGGVDRRSRSNVLRLAAAQALAGANASVIYATGSIIGNTLAPSPSLATLPISVFVVGMALGTLPVGAIARRKGRRTAFILGAVCGAAAGLLGAAALLLQSFLLFCAATTLAGFYGSVVMSFRFAAADGASAAFRPRALSWVMAGGVFAGVLGPQLVTWTMGLWAPNTFVVSYLAQAVVALVCHGRSCWGRTPGCRAGRSGRRPSTGHHRPATSLYCGGRLRGRELHDHELGNDFGAAGNAVVRIAAFHVE